MMPFDKEHYKEIKKFVRWNLEHRPWCSTCTCPFEWARTFLPLVSDCVHREDYEGAKACADAVREFLNQFLTTKIKKTELLKLPEIKDYFREITFK